MKNNSLLVIGIILTLAYTVVGLTTYYFSIQFILNGHALIGYIFIIVQTLIFYYFLYKPMSDLYKRNSKKEGR